MGIAMVSNIVIGGIVVLIVIIAAGAYVLNQSSLRSTIPPTASTTVSGGPTTSVTSAGQETLTLTEVEYSITPSVIYATPGESVVLHVHNAGTVDHSLSITGPGFNVTLMPTLIPPGGNQTLSFTAPAAGNYTFFCPVPGHKDLGMKGTLVVKQSTQQNAVTTVATTQSTAPTTVTSVASTAPTTSTGSTSVPTTTAHTWA
ncbi:MAG: cupredoxin domain-containing protein [Candidatus Micrarchaeota archaeon]|nr:cupredoxin domain-containing protein [Candidatus Micrarchaeota archaeon]